MKKSFSSKRDGCREWLDVRAQENRQQHLLFESGGFLYVRTIAYEPPVYDLYVSHVLRVI